MRLYTVVYGVHLAPYAVHADLELLVAYHGDCGEGTTVPICPVPEVLQIVPDRVIDERARLLAA